MPLRRYILFDGTCGFCHRMAWYIAKHDIKKCFILVDAHSPCGKKMTHQYNVQERVAHSVVLVYNDRFWTQSAALKRVLLQLPGWKIIGLCMHLVPSFLMDWGYAVLAGMRKRLGFKNVCNIADAELKDRFKV